VNNVKPKTLVVLCLLAFESVAHAGSTNPSPSPALTAQLEALRAQVKLLETQVNALEAHAQAAAVAAPVSTAAETSASVAAPGKKVPPGRVAVTVPAGKQAPVVVMRIPGKKGAPGALPSSSEQASTRVSTTPPSATLSTSPSSEATGPASEVSRADLAPMQEQINNISLKTDALEDAATTGPLAGLSITGYIDPLYMYNRAQRSGGFQFLNHDPGVYDYYESQIGDVYLDIKKTFGVGPTAPSAEIVIQPNRGVGSTLSSGTGVVGNNILTQADVTVPLSPTTMVVAGLLPSPIGYEPLPSNMMLTLTHNLLYDFSEPAGMVGIGIKGANSIFTHLWQIYIANEQLRTAGVTVEGPNNTASSNWTPTLSGRFDDLLSTALDIGIAGSIGRQTLFSPCPPGGYGYQCTGSSPFGMARYVETDLTYTRDKLQLNAQLDYGEQQKGAWNGGTARWYGLSLQGHRKWTSTLLGHMGATLRFDYLNDTANGGGASNILYGLNGGNPSVNSSSGFGIDPACFAASAQNGTNCKGASHYDITADLMFFPTAQITAKLEYRHDQANHPVFLESDGSYSRSNDILAAQFIYSF
jgi:hypothetical protein